MLCRSSQPSTNLTVPPNRFCVGTTGLYRPRVIGSLTSMDAAAKVGKDASFDKLYIAWASDIQC